MNVLQKHLVFIPICFIVFAGLFGLLVMMLWNCLMPYLLGLPLINYWQAIGLLMLCKILFGGMSGGDHGHRHGHCGGNKLRQRWESMTPEERKRFVELHRDSSYASQTDSDGK